jgi:3-methyladenine DNA glycosylase Tag
MTYIPPKPKNDAEFLEVLSQIIFVAGFKFSVVKAMWRKTRKAFHNFKVEKVAKESVERMMKKEGVIKNRQKIQAIITNAQLCLVLKKEHGSLMKWVAKVQKLHEKDPLFNPTVREEMQRFERIGKETSRWLAYVATRDKSLLRHGEHG